jgi:hypothetical protein
MAAGLLLIQWQLAAVCPLPLLGHGLLALDVVDVVRRNHPNGAKQRKPASLIIELVNCMLAVRGQQS